MGSKDVASGIDRGAEFIRAVLRDLEALERMLDGDLLERDVLRIGAEQEMFLIDPETMAAAPVATAVLAQAAEPRLTTELGLFNLEANLAPTVLGPGALTALERELCAVLELARDAAERCAAEVLLVGILPTLRQADLDPTNLTPVARYQELDRVLRRRRGSAFQLRARGLDEISLSLDTVLLEAAAASFQVHLEVAPERFVPVYNAAQAVAGPVLAAAVNSPLLLGQRLWQETRVCLFQEAVDERSYAERQRSRRTRVGLGRGWLTRSALELFRDQLARFAVVLTREVDEDPLQVLAAGGIPQLSALALHNGTVWSWNRGCYGVLDGRPALRIESRVLPAGPSVLDEVANAALLVGLLLAVPERYGDIGALMSFTEVRHNLVTAAREGLDATLVWLQERRWPVGRLLTEELLPLARQGLAGRGVSAAELDRYLGVIAERLTSGRTGARWLLDGAARVDAPLAERDRVLTDAMRQAQRSGQPVHRWPPVPPAPPGPARPTVAQGMDADPVSVAASAPVELAARLMDWEQVDVLPVEGDDGRLAGLVTRQQATRPGGTALVAEVMTGAPATLEPDTALGVAAELLAASGMAALPVVEHGRLVGMLGRAALGAAPPAVRP